MCKELAILGMGYSASKAPTNIDRWGSNNAYVYGRIDKLFLMHNPHIIVSSTKLADRDTVTFLDAFKSNPDMTGVSIKEFNLEETNGKPMFNYDVKEPKGTVIRKIDTYPLRDAINISGVADFSSSIPYMIALAIVEGYERIRLYGIEVWGKNMLIEEYQYERPCIERWIHRAEGAGIVVECLFSIVPPMFEKNSLYGYENIIV